MPKPKKTEHAGAKNGGGFWGTREEAKTLSKRQRRVNSKKIIRDEKKSVQSVCSAPAKRK